MILAIFDLQVTLMVPSKFGVNWPFGSGEEAKNRFSEEANWSGSALFAIKYANLYQQSGSGYLIGWKLEIGMASKFIQQDKG